MHRRASTRITPSTVLYVAPTGHTEVHGEFEHCMHSRGMKYAVSTCLPAAVGSVESNGKPLMPPSGESTWSSPSVVTTWRSIQVRVYWGSSGTWFSSLQATTHRPQPMHAAVSTT